jgi:MoaA/NifB/PqqE/SkfB family radical SAM enzyme
MSIFVLGLFLTGVSIIIKHMKRADVKIGFGCNNHCQFCVQGDKRNFCFHKEREEVESSLNEAYQTGNEGVVFTGGEPTLHPDFLDLVKTAKKLGFKEIQIQTNGRMFAYNDFCLQTIKAGANQFSPALHGHNAQTHDFLTGVKGSFKQTVQGIQNLKNLNQYILTNTVITSKNAKYLPEIARLLVDLGVNQFQFAFIHIAGTAKKNKDWIVPKKSEIMKYVKEGLDIGIKAGKKVMTEAIPYCLMAGYEDYIAEKVIPPSIVYDAGFVVEDYGEYRRNQGKAKGPNCQRCKYFEVCEGPWKEYPEIYGWDEFRPVR